MIVVQLCGGLGNQLFQYAAARALADRHGTSVKADLSWYAVSRPGITPRKFELGTTCANFGELSTVDELRKRLVFRLAGSAIPPRLGLRLQRTLVGLSVFFEPHFEFSEDLIRQPNNVVLVGYWQSERYFRSARPELVRELVPRRPTAGRAREMEGRIARARDAVGIHVRRGDYVSSPTAAAFHGQCPQEYYHAAARMIFAERPDAEFFVFSDDPLWCRENLHLPGRVEIVSHQSATDAIVELNLMSQCRHHVISNSSFGWWGAWLSGAQDQIVVCPLRWFKDGSIDTRDLIPATWRRL